MKTFLVGFVVYTVILKYGAEGQPSAGEPGQGRLCDCRDPIEGGIREIGLTLRDMGTGRGSEGRGPDGPPCSCFNGVIGDPGIKGKTGTPGIRGIRGIPGRTGEPGQFGKNGQAGPIGPQGSTGRRGFAGQSGQPGDRGPIGRSGRQGTRGPAGPPGPTGHSGIRGPNGTPGQKGDKGSKGDRGPEGMTGAHGRTGRAGGKGNPGNIGADGEAGLKGPKGVCRQGPSCGRQTAHKKETTADKESTRPLLLSPVLVVLFVWNIMITIIILALVVVIRNNKNQIMTLSIDGDEFMDKNMQYDIAEEENTWKTKITADT